MQKWLLILGTLLCVTTVQAEETVTMEPVVVTATRTLTPLSQVASSITVISAEEIAEKQHRMVLDVLRSVPGVSITRSGPVGGQASIRLRGTDNRHTLVLIDGIEYRDASTIGGGPDLAHLSVDNIAQIEIVRGPQSVLYGSDAIGGVINIITRKGTAQPQAYASVEGGSYNTWRETAGFSVDSGVTAVAVGISRTDTDGFSSYNEKDGFREKDGYRNTSASLNLSARPSDVVSLNLNLRLTDSTYDFDSGYFDEAFNFIRADTDAAVDTLELAGRTEAVLDLADGRWQLILGTAITDTDRDTTGTYDNYRYEGRITKFDLQSSYRINDQHLLTGGVETEKEEYTSSYGDSGEVRSQAVFLQEQLSIAGLSAALGIRYDDHEEFGDKTTWRLAPTYTLAATATRLKASVGTGFKAPSLFQLYYPYGGNRNLKAETSRGWDAGFEQPLFGESLLVGLTYFANDIQNYIDYDATSWTYANIGKLKTEGVESTLQWYPSTLFHVQVGYTYTDAKDGDDVRKARIPLHQGSLDLHLYPVQSLQLTLGTLYTGTRADGATAEKLKAYTLVNLAASYQLNENLKLFGRIDNLFDKDYEEVAGYGTAGLSAYAGVRLSF
ncbi:MAG: TonB-dependent receptor [Pelovirga sp.]